MPDFILPADADYDSARLAWNLGADQRPAAVAVARNVEDVKESLAWARERRLKVTNQTTGHAAEALPGLEGSLLMKTELHDGMVEIDAEARTARVLAGASWDDVITAATPHGLTALHGSSPSVGVIGYLLGGGLSTYGRSHGLACNYIDAFEVVTEDGTELRVDADTEPELFWALRGGGGGLAVVTAVEIELLPMAEVFAGATFLPISAAAATLDAWIKWTGTANDSTTSNFRIMRMPPFEEIPEPIRGRAVVCVDGVSVDQASGEELASLLAECGEPLMGGWGVQPTAAVTRLHGDPEEPMPGTGDSAMLGSLDETAAQSFLTAVGPDATTSLIVAELRHAGGQLGQPARDAGVLDRLDGEFLLFGTGIAADPGTTAATVSDLANLFEAMEPWTGETKFVNFAGADCEFDNCFPREAVDRLRLVFDQYSPQRLFLDSRAIDN
ncbi:MAG: FAD-binding oxidoreductase [Thermoleophilia bacterium]|nr:FAD-binding oxidoreductase [Thermoleophilia bacterium]